jgi:Shikimate dehydrogenase substrate binding domain
VTKQLAVLGSPIGQALSPVLHRAAYTALGLDWSYRAIDCTPQMLAPFLAALDGNWAGLSLTMPLKRAAVHLLDEVSATVTATGTANTVTIRSGRLLGENTDAHGMLQTLLDAGVTHVESACVLGAGATAATALAVLHTLGRREVEAKQAGGEGGTPSSRPLGRATPPSRAGEARGPGPAEGRHGRPGRRRGTRGAEVGRQGAVHDLLAAAGPPARPCPTCTPPTGSRSWPRPTGPPRTASRCCRRCSRSTTPPAPGCTGTSPPASDAICPPAWTRPGHGGRPTSSSFTRSGATAEQRREERTVSNAERPHPAAAGQPWPTLRIRVRRAEDGQLVAASTQAAPGAVIEQVLLPSDWDTLVGLGRIAVGESRARLYLTTHGAPEPGQLVLCLRGAEGAVRVQGPLAPIADALGGRVRAAVLRMTALYRAAGRIDEARRWRALGRRMLKARRAARTGRSVRTASGGLPTLGKRC